MSFTKPIPVFSFVFAAYAATVGSSRSSSPLSSTQASQRGDRFLNAWRMRSTSGGVLLAKVGLLTGASGEDPRLAACNSSEAFEEFWLDNIAETHLGFIGAAVAASALPLGIKPGRRMRFHRINVLDWRLEDGPKARPTRRRERRTPHPHQMLAELSETVGS
jgi:hypothetical protein